MTADKALLRNIVAVGGAALFGNFKLEEKRAHNLIRKAHMREILFHIEFDLKWITWLDLNVGERNAVVGVAFVDSGNRQRIWLVRWRRVFEIDRRRGVFDVGENEIVDGEFGKVAEAIGFNSYPASVR